MELQRPLMGSIIGEHSRSRRHVSVFITENTEIANIHSLFRPNNVLRQNKQQTNSMVRVRKRTIPTERPPLVVEVVANFCG
jgi:hypothetical protein